MQPRCTGVAGRAFVIVVAAMIGTAAWPSAGAYGRVIGVKPVASGVCDRKGFPDQGYAAVVNCTVLRVPWSELQPEPFGPIVEDNAIDRGITEAERLNAEHPGRNVHLKLRVYAGVHAPEWSKQLGGSPVPLSDPETGAPIGTVPRFWMPEFGAAYDDLSAKLAARYDGVAVLVDVVISRCTTHFAEPFLRQASDPANRAAYLEAGYTLEADRLCHRDQIRTHDRAWRHTRSSLALNPFQLIERTGAKSSDVTFTTEMMDYCRKRLRSRCVLGNNSIRWPIDGKGYKIIYERIAELGPPFYFQTATEEKIGDWRETLNWAAGLGANMVELNDSYDPEYPLPELAGYDVRLEQNPKP